MNSVQETINSFSPEQRKLIQRAGISEKEIAKALAFKREHTSVAFLTKANERFLICQNMVEYIRHQRNTMIGNRKTLKQTSKLLKRIAENSRKSEAERTEAQKLLDENELAIRKVDREIAEADDNIERLQAEMEQERAGAQDTLKDIDAMMAMGMCMLHAIDLYFDEFKELMGEVGCATTSIPDLYNQFSELFSKFQEELITANFFVMERGKAIWASDAQTKVHIALADRAEDFKRIFAELCAQALTDINNGKEY